jgi:AAA domain
VPEGRHLPIVLFGGINGGGKTTLLDAIQLALYGVRARCSKRSQMSYDDFLRESIHHGAPETAGVSLSFRYASDGEEHLYDVSRSWRVVEGRVREELRVLKDGVPSLWLADNWPQLMEDIFPLDISGLFFFRCRLRDPEAAAVRGREADLRDLGVDRHYYQALQPHIARAYHLNYDEQHRQTVGEEKWITAKSWVAVWCHRDRVPTLDCRPTLERPMV